MYPKVQMHIDGKWCDASDRGTIDVINPATGDVIGTAPKATKADLDHALAAAEKGLKVWRKVSNFERYKLLRKAAEIMRSRAEENGRILTMEQGKPLVEGKGEAAGVADMFDWFAEEGRRAYGQIIPPRVEGVQQMAYKEPVGVVAAFTPWNFPMGQAARKIAAGLAAGCAIIIKGPEDTPASCAELVRAVLDAGLPQGVLNLVYGVPAEVSEYLIPNPVVKKISFTGSTAVGKQLAALAGKHMKRCTMELGGHAPAIVFDDADIDKAVKLLAGSKYRNAGQVCISPTRFLVQEKVYAPFVEKFIAAAKAVKVGDGLENGVAMGPLAHARRVEAMESFVSDATAHGAKIKTGGKRIGNKGYFFEPTVMTDVPLDAKIMNEEPFGPLAPITPFKDLNSVLDEANRLPYGLAAYAYTSSAKTIAALGESVESGMISINHHGLALVETPFGGIKDSGYGTEGGSEAIQAYLQFKFVSQAGA